MSRGLKDSASVLALCAAEEETDLGNGNRFCHRNRDTAIYVKNVGWHIHDGMRYREDEGDCLIRPLAHRTAEAIRFECNEIGPDEGEALIVEAGNDAEAEIEKREKLGKEASDDEKARWKAMEAAVKDRNQILGRVSAWRASRLGYARDSQNSNKLNNMLKEAAPYLGVSVDQLNADPLALNCRNGTTRFFREEDEESDPQDPRFRSYLRLDPHRREDLITKLCEATLLRARDKSDEVAEPSDFRFDAAMMNGVAHRAAPQFVEFLHRIMPDPDMRAYLQRWFGYMLTGLTGEQVLVFFYGIGANGKSTLADLIGAIMSDYSVTLGIESFTGDARRGGADATPDLARLNGAFGCFANEGDESQRLKEGLIKTLTGDQRMAVRKLHQDFIEIILRAKFVIIGNHMPNIRGDDDGMWRRVHLVEFGVQIPREDRDKHLGEKLLAERDGVLAWMLAGTLDFLAMGGLHPPPSVLAAVQEHRENSDDVGGFVRNGCEVTGDAADSATPMELRNGYLSYCLREGLTPCSPGTFNKRMTAKSKLAWKSPDGKMRQFSKAKSNVTLYRGIRVRAEFSGGVPVPEPDGRPFAPQA